MIIRRKTITLIFISRAKHKKQRQNTEQTLSRIPIIHGSVRYLLGNATFGNYSINCINEKVSLVNGYQNPFNDFIIT